MVGVDFTSANGGAPSSSASLHYGGSGKTVISNPYAATLCVLSTVMQKLSGGRPLEAYGFGAKPAGVKAVPGLFPLTSPAQPKASASVAGPSELVDAYRAAGVSVTPVSVRNYAPMLSAAQSASTSEGPLTQRNQHYTLLALLTCGPMDDAEATVNALLASTQSPLSVLVVGMGPDGTTIESRFAGVRELDEQLAGLHSKKLMSARDNLLLVPMPSDRPMIDTAASLAAASLTVGCDQLVAYMQSQGVEPGAGPEGPKTVMGKPVEATVPGAAAAALAAVAEAEEPPSALLSHAE
jgi:hypothetical protein